jgi:hypothetical protein
MTLMANARDKIARETRDAAGAFAGDQSFTGTALPEPERPAWFRRLPWSLMLLSIGLLFVAASVLAPVVEENRRLRADLDQLRHELSSVMQQADVNQAYLEKLPTDPDLAARIALRQTRKPEAGTKVLDVDESEPAPFEASPFVIAQLPSTRPDDAVPTRAIPNLLIDSRKRILVLAAGIFLIGAAVVFGLQTQRG